MTTTEHSVRALTFEQRIREHEAAGRVIVDRHPGYVVLSKPSGSLTCMLWLESGTVIYRDARVGYGLAKAFECIGVRT